jgi:hypothetical protein
VAVRVLSAHWRRCPRCLTDSCISPLLSHLVTALVASLALLCAGRSTAAKNLALESSPGLLRGTRRARAERSEYAFVRLRSSALLIACARHVHTLRLALEGVCLPRLCVWVCALACLTVPGLQWVEWKVCSQRNSRCRIASTDCKGISLTLRRTSLKCNRLYSHCRRKPQLFGRFSSCCRDLNSAMLASPKLLSTLEVKCCTWTSGIPP